MSQTLPTSAKAKDQAKRLRLDLTQQGKPISHARSLELISQKYGFRDWNTMNAALATQPKMAWQVGDKVTGRYLSQPFEGTVLAIEQEGPDWHRIELDLDAAVDVVTSDGFSNMRKRIRGVVGPKGHSSERTSDGVPHLQIDL